jgi:CBS domain-containing protein
MQTDVSFLSSDMLVEQASRWAVEHDAPAFLVGTRDRLVGAVTREQLEELGASGRAGDPLSSVVTDSFVHAHPDHPIDVVLERLSESGGVLPVVNRAEARRVEGVITRDGILKVGADRTRRRESARPAPQTRAT